MRIEFDQKATVLAVLLLIGLFAGLCWWPRQRERTALRAQVEKHAAQLAADRQRADALPVVREQVAKLRREAADSNKIVPQTSELADLLRRLTSQLDTQNMQEQEIQTEAIVSGAEFNVIPLTLRFAGSYEGVFGFVRGVESMSRLTRINVLEIVGVPTKPQEPVTVRMDITTFSTAGAKQP